LDLRGASSWLRVHRERDITMLGLYLYLTLRISNIPSNHSSQTQICKLKSKIIRGFLN